MKAEMLLRERLVISKSAFVEMVVWRPPRNSAWSPHPFKYRLALVSEGVCVLRFDNEAGKGDHKHIGEQEAAYAFTDLDGLQADFWTAVAEWREGQ